MNGEERVQQILDSLPPEEWELFEPDMADGLAEMSQVRKANLVIKKLRYVWPDTPCANLMFEVLRQSLRNVVYRHEVTSAARDDAIRYLKSDMPHVEIVGVDVDYVKLIIKRVGLEL